MHHHISFWKREEERTTMLQSLFSLYRTERSEEKMKCLLISLVLSASVATTFAFTVDVPRIQRSRCTTLFSSTEEMPTVPTPQTIEKLKADLVRLCSQTPKPQADKVRDFVQELEAAAEQIGIGQASSTSGLLSGEWELLYSTEDETRSSPFFWAFRKAFPDSSDKIFGITDAIPAPLKEVGPAFQQISLNSATQTGRFVSRVKVATLGGMATSIMTTRGSVVGLDGSDGIRIKIDTTKPEDSTVLSTLFGPFGQVINENAPAFPSGDALEAAQPGSSEVIIRTTFCDEGLRISRNADRLDDFYVWRRREFASFDFL